MVSDCQYVYVNIFSPAKLSHATRLVQDDLGNLLMMIMVMVMIMVMMMMMMMVVYVGGVGSCDGLSKTHFFLSHCPLSPLPSGLMWIFSIEFLYFSLCHFLVVIVFEREITLNLC